MSVSPAAGDSGIAHEPESTITIEAEPDPAPQLILPTLPGVTAADIHEPIDEPTPIPPARYSLQPVAIRRADAAEARRLAQS